MRRVSRIDFPSGKGERLTWVGAFGLDAWLEHGDAEEAVVADADASSSKSRISHSQGSLAGVQDGFGGRQLVVAQVLERAARRKLLNSWPRTWKRNRSLRLRLRTASAGFLALSSV